MSEPVSEDDILRGQRDRFDHEAELYDQHHMHPAAQTYRNRFIRERLFDFDLSGLAVLDAMCATGIDSPFFVDRGAEITGLDISPECAEIFRQRFDRPCIAASMHETGFEDAAFDVIYIGGGLHHIAHMIPECIAEIARILKPGGVFCALEPNHDDWSNKVRQLWYRMDSRFEDNERALSYPREILPLAKDAFREEMFFKGGNVAYLPIQQASTLRTPEFVLNRMSGALMDLERALTPIPGIPKFYWCCRWRRT